MDLLVSIDKNKLLMPMLISVNLVLHGVSYENELIGEKEMQFVFVML